jgi:DNA-binding XRE family transcriptional regulator
MKKYRTLGDLLIDYRSFHSISQSELASQLDVDVRSVIRWEKNETLLSSDKESVMSEMTFIPYQVVRNLNSTTQIPTFYDFDLRKYSLSALSSDLPDANWIKSRINYQTDRIQSVSIARDIKSILCFTELQKNPLKSQNIELITEACKLLPELNMVIHDQSGYYSGHSIYFPLSMETYLKIRNREIQENELESRDLINYKNCDKPVFYCHSITADCNENFFYIIGAVLKFYRDTPNKNYLYALLTSRYDSHLMSDQLGVKTVWKDFEAKEKYHLLDAPRLVEGNFNAFLKK